MKRKYQPQSVVTGFAMLFAFVLLTAISNLQSKAASPLPQAATDSNAEDADGTPAAVRAALRVLAADESDPKASETVGRYYCFVHGDWSRGLPLLANSGDAELRAAAQRELSGATSIAQQMEIADQWWGLAKKAEPIDARILRTRARHWYSLVSPKVTGLSKRKCEKRLSEPAGEMEKGTSTKPASSDLRQSGLVFDGQAWLETDLTYDGSTPLTIEAWVTPAASGLQSIVANCHGVGLALQVTKEGHWGFYVRDKSAYRGATSNEKVKRGQRAHLAGVFDDQIVRLFVNGRLQDSVGTLTSGHKVSKFRFMVGADPDFHSRPQQTFQGVIDSVHVANAVFYEDNFTPADPPTRHPSTALLLKLDEGRGDVVKDASAHQRQVKIHGAKWK